MGRNSRRDKIEKRKIGIRKTKVIESRVIEAKTRGGEAGKGQKALKETTDRIKTQKDWIVSLKEGGNNQVFIKLIL